MFDVDCCDVCVEVGVWCVVVGECGGDCDVCCEYCEVECEYVIVVELGDEVWY